MTTAKPEPRRLRPTVFPPMRLTFPQRVCGLCDGTGRIWINVTVGCVLCPSCQGQGMF